MYSLLKKCLFLLEPETAHGLVKKISPLIPLNLIENYTRIDHPALKSEHFGVSFDNPLGLAAGFDKNGEMIPLMKGLGFGHVEIGSVTYQPWQGNPCPRIFRLPEDQSLVNRMGLPNAGARTITGRLSKKTWGIPVGVNIAKTPGSKEGCDEFIKTLKMVAPLASYITLNLSCPNTPDGKTFEDPAAFKELASVVANFRKTEKKVLSILIKLSPDLDSNNLAALVELACQHGFDGFIVSNTTADRGALSSSADKLKKIGNGAVSGRALAFRSNNQIERVYKIVGMSKIIIGVGGILDLRDLLDKLARGASLFQLYTGLVYGGPFLIRKLNAQLADFCDRQGVKNYLDLRGSFC